MKNECVKQVEREMMLSGSVKRVEGYRLIFLCVSTSIDFMAFLYYVNMNEYMPNRTKVFV